MTRLEKIFLWLIGVFFLIVVANTVYSIKLVVDYVNGTPIKTSHQIRVCKDD